MTVTSIDDIADQEFDYVIVGGGTAGLALAARLSENSNITVVVLEAGPANLADPNILIPGQFMKTIGDPKYDWSFITSKQPFANDREVFWSRGKGLGGASTNNFYGWIKPPASDCDALEKLGNPGWNWETFAKYSKKSEGFNEPTEERLATYSFTFNPENHGYGGPIQTCFAHPLVTIEEPFRQTLQNMGLKSIDDPYGGDITGTFIACTGIDPKTQTRSYSANANYIPNQHRPNLRVLTEATVTKVLFPEHGSSEENLTATGVEFIHASSEMRRRIVSARKEVILCAGAVKDPQILELSGIGRKDILESIGVEVKIELPGVGENVQEHYLIVSSFELRDQAEHETLDMMRDPVYASWQRKLHAEHKGMHTVGITSFAYFPLSWANPQDAPHLIDKVVKDIETKKSSKNFPPGLAEQLDLQLQALRDESVPDLELALFPGHSSASEPEAGKKYVTIEMILNHPLSRGSIHTQTQDPLKSPKIDPHYFENDFDMEILVQHVKVVRRMFDVEPWKSTVLCQVDPRPECTTDEDMREYIRKTSGTCWHTIGSCSMLPREKFGVVDPQLKVYGTNNLRVVDISIIPLHIAAHTQTFAYMIAEKAADIILGRE